MYLNNPFKKYLLPLITLCVVSILLLTFSLIGIKNEKTSNKVLEEYPRLSGSNPVFEVLDAEQTLRVLKKGEDCCIVFAFPSCPWCQQLLPILNATALKAKISKIYYVDIKNMRDNVESKDHPIYLEIIKYVGEALDKEKNRLNAPTVVIYKNNKVVDYHLDTVPSHQIVDGILPDMTPEQIEELSKILKEMLLKLYY